jgi:predicted metal-dependent hydrolase
MAQQLNNEWPPPYTIKKHRLARSVKLRASNARGLEITTPFRFNVKHIPDILEQHKGWILNQLSQIAPQQSDELPTELILHAFQETWTIDYVASVAKKLKLMERPQRELVLVGPIENKVTCKRLLSRWIKHQASAFLSAQLERISEQVGLRYDKLNIRDQRTMWGSCNAKKNISLNYKLIFLPPELVTYVLIHELCHTKFLNHSIDFWKLVERFDPDWKTHRRGLRHADRYIPAWMK